MAPRFPRLIVLGAVLLVARAAGANGRYPVAGQLVVDPGDASHIVVRTTYGLVVTRDSGASWSWICEPAIGFNGPEDPAIAVVGDGSILVALEEGLRVTHGDACSWDGPAPLQGMTMSDVSARGPDVIAVAWNGTSSDLWRGDTTGTTWTHVSTLPGFTATNSGYRAVEPAAYRHGRRIVLRNRRARAVR